MSNINDFIKLLDTNVNETFKVYVPSLKQEVDCTSFNVPQQKEVIKCTLNGIKGNISLPKVFNNIILENVKSGDVPILTDRNSILVQLRIKSLGDVIYDEKSELTTLKYTPKDLPFETTKVIEDSGISVTLVVPTLKKDNEYYNILDTKTYDNAGDVVNDLFLYEIAKFIEKIEFKGETAQPSTRDSIQLVTKLPLSLNDKILHYIKTIKDYENSVLTADNGSQIALNARFFNTTE